MAIDLQYLSYDLAADLVVHNQTLLIIYVGRRAAQTSLYVHQHRYRLALRTEVQVNIVFLVLPLQLMKEFAFVFQLDFQGFGFVVGLEGNGSFFFWLRFYITCFLAVFRKFFVDLLLVFNHVLAVDIF